MANKIKKILFMGTAAFAVPSLKILEENGYTVAGVVTAPDRPAGRGRKFKISPVKEYALERNLPLFQPEKLKDDSFVQKIKELNPDIQIVVAFRMLPKLVWEIPPLGTFNLHASLLPQYRGAAPINHAIINGEKETGVTTFFIDEKIDTGRIIGTKKTQIADQENAGELHDRLMILGAQLVLETLRRIEMGNIDPVNQNDIIPDGTLKPAPKIFREDCLINWDQPAESVFNFVRGLSPVPAAFTRFKMQYNAVKQVKVFSCSIIRDPYSKSRPAGEFETDGKSMLHVFCNDWKVSFERIQIEGKRPMELKEFLRGFDINEVRQIF